MSEETNEKSLELANTVASFLEEKHENILINQVASELKKLSSSEGSKGSIIIATSAVKLDAASKNSIQRFFGKMLDKKYPVKNIMDESIIGGVKLEWGDLLLDLSLSGRISSLKRQLLK